MKYHPEDSVKRREEQRGMVLRRIDIFRDFFVDREAFAGVSIDGDKSDALINILDSVVIMLEGGDENDLKVKMNHAALFSYYVRAHMFSLSCFVDSGRGGEG